MVEIEKRDNHQTINILDNANLLSKGFESAPKSKFHEKNQVWKREAENRRKTRIRLCIVGKEQLLGIKEILNNCKRNTRATIYSHNAVIYEIRKNLFLDINPSKDNGNIKELIEKTENWHENLIKVQNKLSEKLCPPLAKTFYKTKENLVDSHKMQMHIKKKYEV